MCIYDISCVYIIHHVRISYEKPKKIYVMCRYDICRIYMIFIHLL